MSGQQSLAVSVSGLTKVYKNGVYGVDGLTFDIPRGQIVGLLGPNGSGKTTTINLLTASFPPTSGSGYVLGYDIRKQSTMIRKSVSLVPQYESIDWSLTVFQNLKVFSDLLNITNASSLIGELLENLELSEYRNTQMEELSGGQIRRVQLARAMLFDSEPIFVDEPTIGLDPVGVSRVLNYLKQQTRSGKTVVLATNIMSEMEQVCDRILFLNHGKILYDGTPSDIIKKCDLKERVTIELRGEPSGLIEAAVTAGLEVESRTPLTIAGNRAGSLILPILANSNQYNISIVGITIHTPSLEDAFIHIANKGGLIK